MVAEKMGKPKNGFTLVELMVAVAIIGVLATIAIAQFVSYRDHAYCARIQKAVHDYIVAQETYYADRAQYAPSTAALVAMGYRSTNQIVITGDMESSVQGKDTEGNCSKGTLTYDASGYNWSG